MDTLDKNPIQVADRLFQTLETLAASGPLGLMELASLLSLNKSTMHRILNSLIYMGYVKQNPENAKYSLTFKIWDLANQVLSRINIVDLARPHLEELVKKSDETAHLVQMDGINAVYIDKVESYSNSVRMVSKIGKSIPLYCSGVGKAMLALLPEEQVRNIWEHSQVKALTPHTITDYGSFSDCLAAIREAGYAIDDEENELGVRCIAACIRDYSGFPQYAFSISAPTTRMTRERIRELSGIIIETKKQLEKEWK